MDAERYQRLMSLFDELCDQPAAVQTAALRSLRSSEPDLADRLTKLLEHDSAENSGRSSGSTIPAASGSSSRARGRRGRTS